MSDPWPSQLPTNATAWETAQELADASRYPQDALAPRRVKDALEVGEDILPVLAWERNVDIWFKDQSLSSKRYITDQSYALHKLKGTKAGLKRYLELAGAEVVSIESPPLMAFPSRDMTTVERSEWLARFQQIRTFAYRNRGAVAGAVYTTQQKWVGFQATLTPLAAYFVSVNGYEYDGHHSYLWEPRDQSETALTTWSRTVTEVDKTVVEYDWIMLPPNAALRWFMDAQMSALYCPRQDPLEERTISVYRDTSKYSDHGEFFSSQTISPGLRLLNVFSEHVLEQGIGTYADWYLDHPTPKMYLSYGRAEYYVYDRLYLYETDRGVTPTPPDARMFLDNCYFQFPPYVSKTKVEITLKLPTFAFFNFMRGYMIDPDMEPYTRTLAAARSASSARDKTLIDTMAWDVVQTSQSTYCGQYTCGSQVRT